MKRERVIKLGYGEVAVVQVKTQGLKIRFIIHAHTNHIVLSCPSVNDTVVPFTTLSRVWEEVDNSIEIKNKKE